MAPAAAAVTTAVTLDRSSLALAYGRHFAGSGLDIYQGNDSDEWWTDRLGILTTGAGWMCGILENGRLEWLASRRSTVALWHSVYMTTVPIFFAAPRVRSWGYKSLVIIIPNNCDARVMTLKS
jgi:hypothetical protein